VYWQGATCVLAGCDGQKGVYWQGATCVLAGCDGQKKGQGVYWQGATVCNFLFFFNYLTMIFFA
jgi:hypothetical protein